MELIGFLLPAAIDLINQKVPDDNKRFWISIGVCAVVGAFINFLQTGFAFETLLLGFDSITGSIMAVFTLSQISYKGIYENSTVRAKLYGAGILSDPDAVNK